MTAESDPVSKPARSRPLRRLLRLVIIAVLLGAAWVYHPTILSWGVTRGLDWALPYAGLKRVGGSVDASFTRPIAISDFRIEPNGSLRTGTAFHCERLTIAFEPFWKMGAGRFLSDVAVVKLRGDLDFRTGALPPIPMKELPLDEQKQLSRNILAWLPRRIRLERCDGRFFADGQVYDTKGLSADFSESETRSLTAESVDVQVGGFRRTFRDLTGVTAWKGGAFYLANNRLTEEVTLERFTADIVRLGGPGFTFDLTAFGGGIRGEFGLGMNGLDSDLDAALIARNLPLAPVPEFLGAEISAGGVVREARLTFHGNPGKALESEMAARINADDVRWEGRGWDSLELGAVLIERKLSLTELVLRQGKNTARAGGDLSIPSAGESFSNAEYSVQVSADIPDLQALAALAGGAFDEVNGKLTVYGTARGKGSDVNGDLKWSGSELRYHGIVIAEARGNVEFRNGEARITEFEATSGSDRVHGRGTVEMNAPHAFNGELQADIGNVAEYLAGLPGNPLPQVQSGTLHLDWQGDGNAQSSSGAFSVRLDGIQSDWTPTGLNADLAGTYSPTNVDFRKIDLDRSPLKLSAQATLAPSGLGIRNLLLNGKRGPLLSGEAFVPIDLFQMMRSGDVAKALDPAGKLYAAMESRDLPLGDLFELFGQKPALEGRLKGSIAASGTAASPILNATIAGTGLRAPVADAQIPSAAVEGTLEIRDGTADLKGRFTTPGFEPVTLQARAPLSAPGAGLVGWINPDAPIEAVAEFPKTELRAFRSFLPPVRRLDGVLTGAVRVENTISAPKITGWLQLQGGAFEKDTASPPVTDVNVRAVFDPGWMRLETFSGAVGAGPFSVEGHVKWASAAEGVEPEIQLRVKGKKVLLARDPGLRLRANIDLAVSGSGSQGSVEGSVRLVDGRVYQRIEILPLLIPAGIQKEDAFTLPKVAGMVPAPFDSWTLQVEVNDETPFLMSGNIAQGNIVPDIRIGGSLGNPVPKGTIMLRNIQAFLPFTTMDISEGAIYFTEQQPLMPILDVRGVAEAQGYEVTAYAFGPLSERKMVLRADPPLAQESIVLLLTTGLVPSGNLMGTGFGQAAIGQSGILLLRAIARQFDLQGARMDSVVNRLQLVVVPPDDPRSRAGLRSDFRLGRGFSATAERDGLGFYNAGVTYTYRFQ